MPKLIRACAVVPQSLEEARIDMNSFDSTVSNYDDNIGPEVLFNTSLGYPTA